MDHLQPNKLGKVRKPTTVTHLSGGRAQVEIVKAWFGLRSNSGTSVQCLSQLVGGVEAVRGDNPRRLSMGAQ